MRKVIVLGLKLFLLAAVAGLALGLTNMITAPRDSGAGGAGGGRGETRRFACSGDLYRANHTGGHEGRVCRL